MPDAPPPILRRSVSTGARPRRLLVTKLDHIGDFITALPALAQLRRAFPRDRIRFVCGPWNEAAAEASGLFDEIRTYSFFPEVALGWDGVPVESVARFAAATAGRFDIAIDLRVDPDTRHLLAGVDAGLRCGIGNRGSMPWLDVVLPAEARGNVFPDRLDTLFGPERFRSHMPRRTAFFHETDFSVTDQYMIDGPDVALPLGRYRVAFGLQLDRAWGAFGASVMIEVTRDARHLVARRTLKRRRGFVLPAHAVLDFVNEHPGAHHEFRLHTGGRMLGTRLRFVGVKLDALDRGSQEERPRFTPAELHVGERLSLLVSLLDQRVNPLYADDILPDAHFAGARTLESLTGAGPGTRRVIVAPMSNSDLRDWPIAAYAELTGLLLGAGCEVALVGSKGQAGRMAEIVRSNGDDPRLHDLSGRTQWLELPSLLREASLVICNNSGIAHLAAAAGANTLAIYSASHQPVEWGPRGARVATLMADVPCSPCGFDRLADCPNEHRCMRAILPADVFAEAIALLGPAPDAEARPICPPGLSLPDLA